MDQYCKETLYFCDFSGGGGGPLSTLWIRPCTVFVLLVGERLTFCVFGSAVVAFMVIFTTCCCFSLRTFSLPQFV